VFDVFVFKTSCGGVSGFDFGGCGNSGWVADTSSEDVDWGLSEVGTCVACVCDAGTCDCGPVGVGGVVVVGTASAVGADYHE